MYIHFTFTSGANPHIAFTEEKAKKCIKIWQKYGYRVNKIGENSYIVDDKEA